MTLSKEDLNGYEETARVFAKRYGPSISVQINATHLLSLIASARELEELKSALEFLDRGDGKRGTHGSDMRAPALLALARRLGWLPSAPEQTKEEANG